MIQLSLNDTSGVPAYAQIVQQVRRAMRLGTLTIDDQLPTVKEAVADLAINPNTVLKAYRDLEREGLVETRPGRGTFVVDVVQPMPAAVRRRLQRQLDEWLDAARDAGLDTDDIAALMTAASEQARLRDVG